MPTATSRHQPPLGRLVVFADAIRLALVLATDFVHAHVVALTDAEGVVRDGVVLTDPDHTIDHAVGYAMALAGGAGSRERLPPQRSGGIAALPASPILTLFSVVPIGDVDRPDDAAWRRICTAVTPLICRDWLITDGCEVRSLAVATSVGSGWPTRSADTGPDRPLRSRGAAEDLDAAEETGG